MVEKKENRDIEEAIEKYRKYINFIEESEDLEEFKQAFTIYRNTIRNHLDKLPQADDAYIGYEQKLHLMDEDLAKLTFNYLNHLLEDYRKTHVLDDAFDKLATAQLFGQLDARSLSGLKRTREDLENWVQAKSIYENSLESVTSLNKEDYATDTKILQEYELLIEKVSHANREINNVISKGAITGQLADDIRDWKDKLENSISQLYEDVKPYQEALSYLPTLLKNEQIGESLQVIRDAIITNQREVQYFRNSEFDASTGEFAHTAMEAIMHPEKAEVICLERWNKYSRYKYEQYFGNFFTHLNDGEPPYNIHPADIQENLENKMGGTLQPLFDLQDKDLNDAYERLKRGISEALRFVTTLERRLDNIDLDQSGATAAWRETEGLAKNIEQDAPCLMFKLEEKRHKLYDSTLNYLETAIEILELDFINDLSAAEHKAREEQRRLADITGFDAQSDRIGQIADASRRINKLLEEAQNAKPKLAREKVTGAKKIANEVIGKDPIQLIEFDEALHISEKPIELASQLIEKTKEKYLSKLADTPNFSMRPAYDLQQSMQQVIEELDNIVQNEKGTRVKKAEQSLNQAQEIKRKFDPVVALLQTRHELEKPDANLNKIVEHWIPLAEANPALKEYLAPLKTETKRFSQNDNAVDIQLESIGLALENKKTDLNDLMNQFEALQDLSRQQSTKHNEIAKNLDKLRAEIIQRVEKIFREFASNPNPKQVTKMRRYRDRYIQIVTGKGPLIKIIDGAISEAEAVQAEKSGNWWAAAEMWSLANDKEVVDAEARYLACLKLAAIKQSRQGNYRPLETALRNQVLREDHDVESLNALRSFEIVEREYSNLESFLEKKATSGFNVVRNVIDQVLGTQSSSDNPNDKEEGSEALLSYGKFLAAWQRYAFDQYLEDDEQISIKSLLSKVDFQEQVYSQLITIRRMVNPKSNVFEIHKGKKFAEGIISEPPWPDVDKEIEYQPDLFEIMWKQYRNYVVQQLQRGA